MLIRKLRCIYSRTTIPEWAEVKDNAAITRGFGIRVILGWEVAACRAQGEASLRLIKSSISCFCSSFILENRNPRRRVALPLKLRPSASSAMSYTVRQGSALGKADVALAAIKSQTAESGRPGPAGV
jgi:hypothetical protein